ncbi:ketopantoate reductase family protein [Sphingobacterium cellulitidis]|uniref:ketopantoate reductase family protein n=1 Tax=Sphingobacterium cellulitidis TaxID=1768011 RepID=UPI003C7A2008
MKVLMFGRGVISTQYAWALEKAGHIVEFYVREGSKAKYGESVSLNIYDARKSLRGVLINENWSIKIKEDLSTEHDYDLIILSVQHYQFESAVSFLANKIGNATLLIFNNFWEEPQTLVSNLPISKIVWGFPVAGGGFDEKGVLKGGLMKTVVIGTFGTEQTQRGREVINLFKLSGFKVKETKDFRSWLFSHFIFNASLHLENLKHKQMSLLELVTTTKYWRNVKLNGKELLLLLKARNVDLNVNKELNIFIFPPFLLVLIIKSAIWFLPYIKQVLIGHSNSYELKSYCKDVLLTAEELKLNLPRYEQNKHLWN